MRTVVGAVVSDIIVAIYQIMGEADGGLAQAGGVEVKSIVNDSYPQASPRYSFSMQLIDSSHDMSAERINTAVVPSSNLKRNMRGHIAIKR